MRKILIGIPAYDGKLCCDTVRSLLQEQLAGLHAGFFFEVTMLPGASLITLGRDEIADQFLASDAEKLVFIDSDVSWERGSVVRLVSHDVDFVGGAYPYKSDNEAYPVSFHKGETGFDKATGLLSVHMVPGGFLALTRNVFEKMDRRFKLTEKAYIPPGQQRKRKPFWWAPRGGGEDGNFCDDWRACGGTVWLDTDLNLGHTGGSRTYQGNIHNWLGKRGGKAS